MLGAVVHAVLHATVAALEALIAGALATGAFAAVVASVGAGEQLARGAGPTTLAVADALFTDTATRAVL